MGEKRRGWGPKPEKQATGLPETRNAIFCWRFDIVVLSFRSRFVLVLYRLRYPRIPGMRPRWTRRTTVAQHLGVIVSPCVSYGFATEMTKVKFMSAGI